MTLEEKIDESIERIREGTAEVLENEKSANDVLKKVTAKLMQIVASYKMSGVCPSRRELEDCCSMILAIGISCDAKPL